mgnify:CR=1 FL=1
MITYEITFLMGEEAKAKQEVKAPNALAALALAQCQQEGGSEWADLFTFDTGMGLHAIFPASIRIRRIH